MLVNGRVSLYVIMSKIVSLFQRGSYYFPVVQALMYNRPCLQQLLLQTFSTSPARANISRLQFPIFEDRL